MRPFSLLLILCYSVSAAPNWVPPQNAAAFDRVIQDSKTYEAILRAEYEVTGCEFDKEFVKVTIRRGVLVGDLYLDVKADKCDYSGKRFRIILKPVDNPFPWKEILITGILSLAVGFAAGSGIGK